MAVIFEDALKKNIEKGQFAPVYVFFGDDGYLIKTYCEKIAKKITEKDDVFNFATFSNNFDFQELYDCVMQFPFMQEKKYVEVYNYEFDKAQKEEIEKLCTLIADVPDTTVFVLRFDAIEFDSKKNEKFKKISAAAERNGGIVCELKHRGVPELVKMLCDGALKRGVKFDSSAARYLVDTAGNDINILKNELIKLCCFVKEGVITKETVDTVCVKTVEASIFNLTKYIFALDATNALKMIDDLLYMRIEPMTILYNISSAYVDMFRLAAAKNAGLGGEKVIEKYASQYPANKHFLINNNATNNLRKFDAHTLDLSLEELCEADKKLKSFALDQRIVLEQLIVRLIYIIAKGESVDKA